MSIYNALEEEPYKRYIVFSRMEYDSLGGLNDVIAHFDSREEALDCADKEHEEYEVEVFDRMEGKIIYVLDFYRDTKKESK